MNAPSSMQRLLGMFSVAVHEDSEIVVHERDEPQAPAAIRQWATCAESKLHAMDLGDLGSVLFVETREYRRGIQVYCLPQRPPA